MATRTPIIPVAQRNQPVVSPDIVLVSSLTLTLEITGVDFLSDSTTTVELLVERFVDATWQLYSRGTFAGGPPPLRDGGPMGPSSITSTYPPGTYRATLTPNKRFRFGVDRIDP